jgi:GeoRSP system SPASM domain protein
MNLRELPSPLRIYWDLPDAPSDPALCSRICREIIETKMLFLSLHDPVYQEDSCCRDVLDALKGDSIAISLTIPETAAKPSFLDGLRGSAVTTLFIDTSSMNEVRSALERIRLLGEKVLPACISFDIGKANFGDVTAVVSSCLEDGIRELVFPIQRLSPGGGFFCPERRELDDLAAGLRELDHRGLQITIHDPFLWHIFYPGADYHEGGCQAANSMLYLSPDYRVYPCPSMPLELGDLRQMTLKDIINSSMKKELRRSLLAPPIDCAPCPQADKCVGGCRGRALAATGSFDHRDPACGYV